MFASLKAAAARGVSRSFRFPGHGGGGYGGYGGGFLGGPWGGVPGTDYDYARQAGILWLNGIAMTVLGWINRAWPEAKLVIHRPIKGDKPEILTEHPALDLLSNPNRDYDDVVLTGAMMLSLLTGNGNSYLFKQRSAVGYAVGLQYVPHFLISPIWPSDGSKFISGYRYRVDGATIDYPDTEIVHHRNPSWPLDPANPRQAIHPLAGEIRSICNDNEERNFSASTLRNMGIPGAVLSPKDATQMFTPAQQEVLVKLWAERFTGDNRGRPLGSTIPLDVQLLGFSPEQLATDKLARLNIARICAAMGIDPQAVGLPSERATFNNVEQARKAAYENLIIPLQTAFDSQMTKQLMGDIQGAMPGDRFARDYSDVACLHETMDTKYKRLSEAVKAGWLTPNMALEQVGIPPVKGGDELAKPGIGGMGQEGKPPPQSASLSPVQTAIASKWRQRASIREVEKLALIEGRAGTNGEL